MSGAKQAGIDAVEGLIGDLANATDAQAMALSVAAGLPAKRRLNANERHRIAAEAARLAEKKAQK